MSRSMQTSFRWAHLPSLVADQQQFQEGGLTLQLLTWAIEYVGSGWLDQPPGVTGSAGARWAEVSGVKGVEGCDALF